MVEIIGSLVSQEVANGEQISEWRIPALSEGFANRQARLNARAKGFSNVSVDSVENRGQGEIPGQKIYRVVTVSDR